MDFSTHFLFASLFWSAVGGGYFVYGKKQQSMVPLIGGIVMIAVSFFLSAGLMTLVCLLVAAAVYYLMKHGYD